MTQDGDELPDSGRLAAIARSGRAQRIPVPLPGHVCAALLQLAQRHCLALDAVVLAAWALVQSRYDLSPDLVVRHHSDSAITDVRVRVDGRRPVVAWLREVDTACTAGRSSQARPDDRGTRAACTVAAWTRTEPDRFDVATPVAVLVGSDAAGVHCALVHRLSGTERPLAHRMVALLGHVLAQLVTAPAGAQVRGINLLTDEERHRVVHAWNSTTRSDPSGLLLHHLFERQVAARPDAVAVVHDGTATSYAAIDTLANQWARRLVAAGAGPETVVGVHLDRSAELIAVLLGVLKAGACYLPLDSGYPPERLQLMADDAGMPLVVSAKAELGLRTHRPVTVLTPGARDRAGHAGRVRGDAVPDNLAYVLYTSGSTGRPKGVALTHRNVTDLVFRVGETFGSDLDRVLAATSVCFDCSIIEIFGTLGWGGTVVLAETAVDVGTCSEGQGVRLLHTVPSVVDELLRTDRLPSSTRTAIVGGERLLPGVVDRIYANSRIDRLVNIYGPVECTTYVTLAEVRRVTTGPPAIGRPAANTRIHLLDLAGEPAAVGFPGELCAAGAGLGRGYLHQPGATAERFTPDPFSEGLGQRLYRTGDLACRDETGELHFLGRLDDQIKVRGVRIEPAEVERVLLEHPAVLEAAVVMPDGVRLLTAYLVTGTAVPTDALREFVGARLPRQLCPDTYVVLGRLPRTPNGKVDRRRLAGSVPEYAGPIAPVVAVAPVTALELQLAGLWGEALEREPPGVHDNLFDLGGHSLIVLSVRARLARTLGRDLPVRLFFECPTIAAQAAELDRCHRDAPPFDPAGANPAGANPTHALRRRPGAPAPLSPNQRAILARVRARPDDPGLVFPLAVRLSGPTAAHALADACTELVRRHESLRTRIVDVDGTPGQEPLPSPTGGLPLVDLSGLGPECAAQVNRRLIADFIGRPIDVLAGPLSRMALFRLGREDHAFGLALHHLVADAWSIETLSHQLVSLYSAGIHGRPPTVAAPRVQYVEWGLEQSRWLESDSGHAQLVFWRKELADLPVLRLPEGRRRMADPPPAVMRSFHIGADITHRLAEVGRGANATRYMVLLAVFAILLNRRTGQTDLAVGCPTAGRDRPELIPVVGPCHDALVLRVDVSGDPTFRELLHRVRGLAVDAYSHQDLPFSVLADELARGGPEHPLFQAGLGFQERPSLLNYPYSRELLGREPVGGLAMSGMSEVPLPPTALDLELAIAVDPDAELEGVLTCRSDVIDADEIAAVAEHYHALLDAATARPDAPISEL